MSTSAPTRAVLVAGATGLVGRSLVAQLAADHAVSWIALPVRRPLGAHAFGAAAPTKLRPAVVDFDRLDEHSELFAVEQVFVCLGTTIKDAGSQDAFRKVDHDYVLAAARLGAKAGARDLLIVTALGADPRSRIFYNRVKGEVERDAAQLPYRSVALFRPSLLLGERASVRPGERVGGALSGIVGPLLRGPLARYRPVRAEDVAAAMVAVARAPGRGVRVIESDEIVRLARGGAASASRR